jgi:tetratricopeptide (TPR) repeat protein
VGRGTALIDEALARAERLGSPQNRFQALCFGGCSTAVLCHDAERLAFYLGLLDDHAREFSLWAIMANAYRGCLAWLEGRFAEARDLLESYFATGVPSASLDITFLTILADMRLKLGDADGAQAAILDAWARRSSEQDPFIAPQFHRMQADLLLARHGTDNQHMAGAADLYRQSIMMARHSGTLAFEIPATLALARLELTRKRPGQALAALRSTLEAAPEGEDLPLMREVRQWVEAIEPLPRSGTQ